MSREGILKTQLVGEYTQAASIAPQHPVLKAELLYGGHKRAASECEQANGGKA